MIIRIWHGYTKKENALAYQTLLRDKIFPYIARKNVRGYRKIELIRRELPGEIEFITLMSFESMQDVVDFAGPEYF